MAPFWFDFNMLDKTTSTQIARFIGPTYGAHLGPVGPKWAPCGPHVAPINLCYEGLEWRAHRYTIPWPSRVISNENSITVSCRYQYPYYCNGWIRYPTHQSVGQLWYTVYPMKYAHGFVVLCFVVVMQSFIMNSHEVFIHIHQGCFAGTGAIVRLPQCQWSKPDGYGKISQCITTTKHSRAKTVCIFLGIYCRSYNTIRPL